MPNAIKYARDWYVRYERPLSSVSLIGGFVFDALTLKRVDTFWENFWVLVHLLVVAIVIILINREENEGRKVAEAHEHFWLRNILQFAFGGLLSTFLVFYFRSASIISAWPFLLILAAAFAANERLKEHYERLLFQISLFYFSIFSFSIFLVPVVLHHIGAFVFILSGLFSLILIRFFLHLLARFSKEKFLASETPILRAVFGIFIIINALYFTNLIPPIPLSIKDAGVFHNIIKNADGTLTAEAEKTDWRRFITLYEPIHLYDGGAVYAYSAVFSPTDLNTDVIHLWQRQDSSGKWITESSITLPVIGGREGGYRTYSARSGLAGGHWRVNVETQRGQVIGTIRFNIIPVSSLPSTYEASLL